MPKFPLDFCAIHGVFQWVANQSSDGRIMFEPVASQAVDNNAGRIMFEPGARIEFLALFLAGGRITFEPTRARSNYVRTVSPRPRECALLPEAGSSAKFGLRAAGWQQRRASPSSASEFGGVAGVNALRARFGKACLPAVQSPIVRVPGGSIMYSPTEASTCGALPRSCL